VYKNIQQYKAKKQHYYQYYYLPQCRVFELANFHHTSKVFTYCVHI